MSLLLQGVFLLGSLAWFVVEIAGWPALAFTVLALAVVSACQLRS